MMLARALAGAFSAASLVWIAWGVFTPGDFFASGSAAVWLTLAIAAAAGGYLCGRSTSRGVLVALVVTTALCLLFWIAVPDGWWATEPPMPNSVSSP